MKAKRAAEFALRKSNLSPAAFRNLIDVQKVRWRTEAKVENALFAANKFGGIFEMRSFWRHFTFDGSIKLYSDPTDSPFAHFFARRDRVYNKSGMFILRGPRYLVSINPALEVRQKLRVLSEDFRDAAEMVMDRGVAIDQQAFLEQSGVLDYLKNAAVTLLNALIQPEKLGNFKLKSRSYQQARQQMINFSVAAVRAYYAHLAGIEVDVLANVKLIRDELDQFTSVTRLIEQQYVEGSFSSRYFTRPEAVHPLIITASCLVTVESVKDRIAAIIGLPSGGTELAMAHQYAFESLTKTKAELILLPISLHTIKAEFDENEIDEVGFDRYLSHIAPGVRRKPILIVEDNSSTGRTLQMAYDRVRSQLDPGKLYVSVAEADIIRSYVDRYSESRVHIASAETYDLAVSILPVSRTLAPKTDMRGLAERRRLAAVYRKKIALSESVTEQIMNKVFLRVIEHPYEEIKNRLGVENSISLFRRSFLSNFYGVAIHYRGIQYPSVEHAYQAQKFLGHTLATAVHKDDVEHIEAIIRKRGQLLTIKKVDKIFTSRQVPAGTLKIVANYLRRRGYARPDWDDIKIPLMIDLLRQKFEHPTFKRMLIRTRPKYLAEGNTWNDTLWGVCRGRGRNMLGHVLMILRDDHFRG